MTDQRFSHVDELLIPWLRAIAPHSVKFVDKKVLDWLNGDGSPKTGIHPQDLELLEIFNNRISAHCRNLDAASILWRSQHLVLGFDVSHQKYLTIYVGRQLLDTTLPEPLSEVANFSDKTMINTQSMLSTWAKQNPYLFQAQSGTSFVYSTNQEKGFQCLAVKPEFSPERLNKQDILGKPLRHYDDEIAIPRERLIQQVIETGEVQKSSYEHIWNGLIWRFQITGVLLTPDEVLVNVEDNPQDPRAFWQKGYWQNKVS